MSPFKSEAQRRKFAEMVKLGTMKQSVFDEWAKATGDAKLPERVPFTPKEDRRRQWEVNEANRKARLKR